MEISYRLSFLLFFLVIMEPEASNLNTFRFQNGLYGDTFQTNYFEVIISEFILFYHHISQILWLPKALPSSEISWNEDNINIDIWLSNERRMEKIDGISAWHLAICN